MAQDKANIAPTLANALQVYKGELEKRIKGASSDQNAAEKNYSSVLDQLQNKTCSYLKYQALKDLYQNIDQCISIGAYKESELIKSNVEALIKDSETLMGQMGDISKTLKKVKVEVYAAKEIACNLVDCCLEKERNEKPDLYNALCEIPEFSSALDGIKGKATSAYEMANLTFCATVNVSGIQGFASIDSLKPYSEDLVAQLKIFEKDIQDNCKSITGSIESTIKDRTELLNETAVSKYSSLDTKCEEMALCETWNTIKDKKEDTCDHPEEGKRKLKEICEKFKDEVGGSSDPGNGKFD